MMMKKTTLYIYIYMHIDDEDGDHGDDEDNARGISAATETYQHNCHHAQDCWANPYSRKIGPEIGELLTHEGARLQHSRCD